MGNVAALAVDVPIIAGVADVNCMLLVAGVATFIVTSWLSPVTTAVIISDPELHPLSLYVDVAVPAIVVTGVASVALPALTQGELKATEMGTVAREPPKYICAATVLVP